MNTPNTSESSAMNPPSLGHVNSQGKLQPIPSDVIEHAKMLKRVEDWRSERDVLQHALRARRIELQDEIQSIDAALEELTTKPNVVVTYSPADSRAYELPAIPSPTPTQKRTAFTKSDFSIRIEKLLKENPTGLSMRDMLEKHGIPSSEKTKLQWFLASAKKRGKLRSKGSRLNMKYFLVSG